MSEVDKILEELYRLELDRGLRMRASIEEDRGIISKSDIEKSYNKDVNVLREASWLISSSRARLSEAVKVLEEISCPTQTLGLLWWQQKARDFLATLGEENNDR